MKNYIGRMSLPTRTRWAHAGWFESRNEQENYRDLLLTQPVVQMATQPLRLTWAIDGGVRSHVPDALCLLDHGRVLLVDVTRRERLRTPEARAIFLLTRATARRLGWTYVLRGELSEQHQTNVSHVYSHRHPFKGCEEWVQRVQNMPATRQVADVAATLGRPGQPNYAAVWHLVAQRHLDVDLTVPLRPDSFVHRHPRSSRSLRCLLTD